jgi:hypothetical protein
MSNQKNLGWISIHRQIKSHWLWEEKRTFSKAEAWIDILLSANHTTNDILLGNELITVQRGSYITSEVKLMKRWNWSKSKVRAFLLLLDTQHMVYKTTDTKKTTLTVVKYEDYQDSKTAKGLRTNFKQTSKGLQKDTNNNDNNDNNENKENNTSLKNEEEFYYFWDAYDKKKDKKKCFSKWLKLNVTDKAKIFETVGDYIKVNSNEQYRKNPLSYLNGECWNDDIKVKKQNTDFKLTF